MPISYPADFPCPMIDGFGISVISGVIRADAPGHNAQRRVFDTMQHRFRMSFAMSELLWARWHNWVNVNGYTWFVMALPSMYAGRLNLVKADAVIRFTSPMTAVPLTDAEMRVTVEAELSPSAILVYRRNI